MRMTIILLVVLGVVAGICAVVLVSAVSTKQGFAARRAATQMVVAKNNLPAWKVLTVNDVEVIKAPRNEVPVDAYTNTAAVVGKVLTADVVIRQPITKSKILTQGGPAEIAAILAPGMRAVSVTVSSDQVSGGLLYPQCFVDVLASFQLISYARGTESPGEAVATTLLERIKVLAIAGESAITNPDKEGKDTPRASSRRLTVTLELDSKQAESLQLAVNNGTISLVLRNPTDMRPVDPQPMVLNSGQLSGPGRPVIPIVGSINEPEGGSSQGSAVEVWRGSKKSEVQFTEKSQQP
ncbi:MAG: Flp pilus assembly protein CpaB [Planctomycetales bacterium]|nr:Flp pilus assembly protein CpaB [Planctomycetales bacterium]